MIKRFVIPKLAEHLKNEDSHIDYVKARPVFYFEFILSIQHIVYSIVRDLDLASLLVEKDVIRIDSTMEHVILLQYDKSLEQLLNDLLNVCF